MNSISKLVALLLFVTSVAMAQAPSDVAEMNAELAMRDSVMAVRDSSCSVEKDSLRKMIETEQAKSANWEQSYNMVKTQGDVCGRALGVALESSKKKKEEEEDFSAMAAGSSFLGGIGIGVLIMWLIMK